MSQTKRAYKFRFYPTDEQRIILAQTFGCCRFVYNLGLHTRSTAYKEHGEKLSYNDPAAMLPDLKKTYPWLGDISSVPVQQSLRHLDRAFKNFFAGRAKHPTFKKRRNSQSATYTANAFKWDGETLTLAKMDAPLDIHWHRALPKECEPSSVTITRDCANRYFVSILVEQNIKPLPVVTKKVGIDLGLKSMAIFSTGEAVGNPQFFAKDEKRLAKAIGDVGWGEFVRQLEYKAKWYGRTLVKIDRFYPLSKTCSACLHVLDSLPLDIREWVCPACGVVHDRDTNAALNILAEGHAARCLWREWKTRSSESSSGNSR